MSDPPIDGCMNTDTLGCAVSFVKCGIPPAVNISAERSSIFYVSK